MLVALEKAPIAVALGPTVPAVAFWPIAVELALPPTNDWKPTAVSPVKATEALAPTTTALAKPWSVALGPITTESVPELALMPIAMAFAPVANELVPMAMVLALFAFAPVPIAIALVSCAFALSPMAIDDAPKAALLKP